MKILAIESSALVASVAIIEDGTITAEYSVNYKKTHSETLLPMIDEIIRMTGTDLASLDAIAVSAGPGSFTGLRIGAATAKGMCLALDIPLISVPTLEALAYNMCGTGYLICPIMDARRMQVYTGLYTCENEINTVLSQRAVGIDELIEYLQSRHAGEKVIFLGDGVPVFKDIITARLGDSAIFAAAPNERQRAASVAALGEIIFQNGGAVSSDDFSPEYLRQSQAEREYTEVRKASCEDAKIAASLEAVCFDAPWDEAFIASLLKNPCNEVLLAYHEDVPVGYLICQKVSGEGEILRIGVKPDIRRAGIGRRLITVMEEDKKTDCWSLEVRSGNEAAIGLYRICGYKETRIRQDYYSDPVEDALCMEHIIRE